MGRPGYKSISVKKADHENYSDVAENELDCSIPKAIKEFYDEWRRTHPKKS